MTNYKQKCHLAFVLIDFIHKVCVFGTRTEFIHCIHFNIVSFYNCTTYSTTAQYNRHSLHCIVVFVRVRVREQTPADKWLFFLHFPYDCHILYESYVFRTQSIAHMGGKADDEKCAPYVFCHSSIILSNKLLEITVMQLTGRFEPTIILNDAINGYLADTNKVNEN